MATATSARPTPTSAPPNVRPAPLLSSGQLAKETGLPQSRIQELVAEGLPAYQLDTKRFLFDRDEAIAWLDGNGYLATAYKTHIKRLVDAAPPLTADQAAKIRAVLSGGVR
jgi:hypothetical protein